MAPLIRNLKNAMYTSTEADVRNATSNEPTNTPLHELSSIASKTFSPTLFPKIMHILETRLNDKGKSWRHVLKSLQVLEYCLIHGSEATGKWCKANIHYIRTLKQFVYVEEGIDVGANVRVAASTLTNLISDPELLQSERQKQGTWKSRLPNITDESSENLPRSRAHSRSQRRSNEDDLQMKLAIEASINQAKEEEEKRRAGSNEDDLAKAIKLSQEEDEARRRQHQQLLQSSQSDNLISLTPTPGSAGHINPVATGWNQGYQQQGPVDWFGNPVDPNVSMQTGYLDPHAQAVYPTGFVYPQATGFLPQATGQAVFGPSNPYGVQSVNGVGAAATGGLAVPNPWAAAAAEQQVPQPTGSNNPFAVKTGPMRAPSMPTLKTMASQPTTTFSLSSPANGPSSAVLPPTMSHSMPSRPGFSESDSHLTKLNQLLATGEGVDTFGNSGETRIPTQLTAATYVNSTGVGTARAVQQSATGLNPFVPQFTGINRMGPMAQTGSVPGAGMMANPFGVGGPSVGSAGPGQRNRQDPPNLIDI